MTKDILPIKLPPGMVKQETSKFCWKTVHKLVFMIFGMAEDELLRYINTHQGEFSRAERVLLNESHDPKIIWALLERCIGKSVQPIEDNRAITHDDLMKRLEEIKRESRAKLIEQEVETK